MEITFEPSRFVSKKGEPWGEDSWGIYPSWEGPKGWSLLPVLIRMPGTR